MPRAPRIVEPGGVCHITARAVADTAMVRDDRDSELFLGTVSDVIVRYGWKCLMYCVMPNHYHLLVTPPQANLARGMQRLNGRYAQRFNERYERAGHLFGRRYWNGPIESEEHLFEAARYIPLNPVRAGLCARPEDWRWSGYRACAGLEAAPDFLSARWLLGHFGNDSRSARESFREHVEAALIEPCL